MKYIIELDSSDEGFYDDKKMLDNALKNSVFKSDFYNAVRSLLKYQTLNGKEYKITDRVVVALEGLQDYMMETLEEDVFFD